MLSEDQRKEIEAEICKYAQKRAAAPEGCKIVQGYHRWLSSDKLRDIAEHFEMTVDELDSVISSYDLIFRKPVGKHLILVCDSVSCWITGYEKIIEHLKSRLDITFGQTTADGRFTLLPAACLGACDRAPAIMIDDTLYGNVDPSGIDSILEKYE